MRATAETSRRINPASTPHLRVIRSPHESRFDEFINGERRESVIISIGVEHENPPLSSVDFRGRLGGRVGRHHTRPSRSKSAHYQCRLLPM
jgi:hypothetical protein